MHNPEKLTPEAAMSLFVKMSCKHFRGQLSRQWGEFGRRGRNIEFTDDGLARLANVVGWIVGMSQSDAKTAQSLAAWLAERLDYLGNYGGVHQIRGQAPIPNYIVELSDDGDFGCFGLLWFKWKFHIEVDEPVCYVRGLSPHVYRYVRSGVNGGLVFHPPSSSRDGGAPAFAVRLDDDPNPWGVHT